jgi:alanyl aminopeptidase
MKIRAVAITLLLAHCAPAVSPTPQPVAKPAAPETVFDPPEPALRLPRHFLPTQYAARLAIDPSKDRFTGSIAITGTLHQRSSVIWLHGWHLEVAKATARQGTREVSLTVTPTRDDLLQVRASRPLDPGEWTLAIDYTGEINAVNSTGAFKQRVGNDTYVYSKFESLFARRVFPSLDEPDSKVPWKLTLDVPKQLTAVSNTPQVSEVALDDTMKRVEFARTKPLPTYLVAFGVGPFDIVDAGKTKSGTPVRIVTLANRAADAAYAAKTAPRLLELEEEWFGIPYPYEKLDIITVPVAEYGAMENAGLISCTESAMLVDPKNASQRRRLRVVSVAAHEIAHQWFGDLVTARFWDDIWLNEGFATWLEAKITSKLEPDWHEDESVLDERNSALRVDALGSARQVRQPITSPDDILNAFDGITYKKGASVLTMFESYVGADVFQRGVRDYLATRAWGNATSEEFVAAISKAAGKDLGPAFASFLEQPGAPQITTTLHCDGAKAQLTFAQERYVPPGATVSSATKPWLIPICIAYEHNGQRSEVCTEVAERTSSLTLDGPCPRWFMPNAGGHGYFRNAYTVAQVTSLRDEAWAKLSSVERRAVFFDVQNAARTGDLPLELALTLVPKLLAEDTRFTVSPALAFPSSFDPFVPDSLRSKYEAWLRSTFGAAARKAGLIGQSNDSLDVESTRAELVSLVGEKAHDPALVAEAVRLVDKGWRDLPDSIREVALAIAVDAKPKIFARILRDVLTEPDRARRDAMYTALASVRDVTRQKQALALLLEPKVDTREAIWMLFYWARDANCIVAQQFFRDHRDEILARMPKTDRTAVLASVFTNACNARERDAMAEEATKTFGSYPGGERIVKQAIETGDQCIARRAIIEPALSDWLRKY